MASERINYLAEQFFNQSISDEEKKELADWICQVNDDAILKDLLEKAWHRNTITMQMPEGMPEKILSSVFDKAALNADPKYPDHEINRTKNISWLKVCAAAAIFAFIIIGFYLFYQKKDPGIAKIFTKEAINKDVPPHINRAILTLSDGTHIALDSASNGILMQEGNSTIVKLSNGEIAYRSNTGETKEVLYNTMRTPVGSQYQLVLPDGSKVWLNAVSSIRFPANFSGKKRIVQISGEAYFEIAASSPKIPFIVQLNKNSGNAVSEIEVLGTHFNVKAYEEDEDINTTLLEGSVKITHDDSSAILIPGTQAQLDTEGAIKIIKDANTEEALAWKNGYFQYESADLATVLRDAARWYDLDLVFAGQIPEDRFTGKIERSVDLSHFLKWLHWSDVDFKLDGKKIIVM